MIFTWYLKDHLLILPGWGQHILHTGMMTMSDAIRSMCWALLAAFWHDLEGLLFVFLQLRVLSPVWLPEAWQHRYLSLCLLFQTWNMHFSMPCLWPMMGQTMQVAWFCQMLCSHDIMSSFLQQIQTFIESNNQWTKDSCASWAIPCASVEICDFCGSDWILLQYFFLFTDTQ